MKFYLVIVGWLLLGALPLHAETDAFRERACWPGLAVRGERLTCGVLRVPENRAELHSRTLELAVVIARGTDSDAVPLIYVQGGPGAPTLRALPELVPLLRQLKPGADLIVMDARGTGFSGALTCPEARRLYPLAPTEAANEVFINAIATCQARWTALGVDFRAYTISALADDWLALREALAIPVWDGVAVSYGTRVALDMLRRADSGLRRLVLDSVVPPDKSLRLNAIPHAERALSRHLSPAQRAQLDTVLSALNAQPRELNVSLPRFGLFEARVSITGDRVYGWLLDWLSDEPESIASRVAALLRGDLAAIAPDGLRAEALRLTRVALGTYYAITCQDDALSPEAFDAVRQSYPQRARVIASALDLGASGARLCAPFVAERLTSAAPVVSDVPVLLLSGANDPLTPPEWAIHAASTLSRGRVVILSGVSHATLFNSLRARQIAARFLHQGNSLTRVR